MDDPRSEQEEGPQIAEERPTEAEQALADAAQVLGDRDQRSSDLDRQRCDTRAEATRGRQETSRRRDRTASERDVVAQRRDESSTLRDQIADDRDKMAAHLDARDDVADRHTLRVDELRGRGRAGRRRAANDRAEAGRDRARATSDRDLATGDRKRAEGDRAQAVEDRDRADGERSQAEHARDEAGTDELTGTRRRGVGLEELDNEIKRSRRAGDGLIAAFVDVDGLKLINDQQGHAAGDELLRTVADGFRRHMRPYDLIVRLGGDEFLCALPDISLTHARLRFDHLRAELNEADAGSVSIGYAELRETDSADDLVNRADSALLASRR